MNLHALLAVSWAAVLAFIAASYFYLLLRRRGGQEYLWFAVFAAFLGLHALGCYLQMTATDEAALAVAMNLRLCSVGVASCCGVAFAHNLIGRPRDPWITFAWVVNIVAVALTLAGVFVDPAESVPFRATWVDVPPNTALSLSPLLLVWAATNAVFGVVTTARVIARPKDGADLRLLALGGFTSVPAFVVDVALSTAHVRSFTVLEHGSALCGVLISWMLLKRILATGDELAARTGELKRTYEERQQIQEELVHQEQLAAVGELSAIIAHEVRNPLAVLKSSVAALRRTSLSQEIQVTLLNSLNDESDRLNQLVGNLLAYARPVSLETQAVSLSTLIEVALDRVWRAMPRSERVEVTLTLDAVPRTLRGDRELLERVFINVFENALQAMPDGGSLLVSGEAETLGDRNAVRIRVQDSGEGMDTLVRSRAGQPFFTTKPSGTGLGLAIVSRIVGAHGGAIEYLSRRGEPGTTVSIVLPLRPSLQGEASESVSDSDADRPSEI